MNENAKIINDSELPTSAKITKAAFKGLGGAFMGATNGNKPINEQINSIGSGLSSIFENAKKKHQAINTGEIQNGSLEVN